LKSRLQKINDEIKQIALNCDRDPQTVKLVAVSKKKPAYMVEEAVKAGVNLFGENYIQEAIDKISQLSQLQVSWHFIGHLQSNKAKFAVKLFDLIHSVDTIKLAKEIDKQALKIEKIQNILIQINIGKEESKSGIDSNSVIEFMKELSCLNNISVRGLMAMPPFFNDPESTRPFFVAMKNIQQEIIKAQIPNIHMDELSMGMSGDFKTAIEEGATLIRIGTAIFGKRD